MSVREANVKDDVCRMLPFRTEDSILWFAVLRLLTSSFLIHKKTGLSCHTFITETVKESSRPPPPQTKSVRCPSRLLNNLFWKNFNAALTDATPLHSQWISIRVSPEAAEEQ